VKKQGDANAVDVSKLVREKFKSIEQQNANSGVNLLLQTIAQTILLQQLIPLFLI
jgi:multidrug efflux pump subunit AcrB